MFAIRSCQFARLLQSFMTGSPTEAKVDHGQRGRLTRSDWRSLADEAVCPICRDQTATLALVNGDGHTDLDRAEGRLPPSPSRRPASSHKRQSAWQKASLRCAVMRLPDMKPVRMTSSRWPEHQLGQPEHQAGPRTAVWVAVYREHLQKLSTMLSSRTAGRPIRCQNRCCQTKCQHNGEKFSC